MNPYIRGVVLAVKPLRILPRLTRFSRRDSALSSRDVSDELSEKEATPFLLFFSTILVASVTGLPSILTFFFRAFFFGISVTRRNIDDTSDTASRVYSVLSKAS